MITLGQLDKMIDTALGKLGLSVTLFHSNQLLKGSQMFPPRQVSISKDSSRRSFPYIGPAFFQCLL